MAAVVNSLGLTVELVAGDVQVDAELRAEVLGADQGLELASAELAALDADRSAGRGEEFELHGAYYTPPTVGRVK
jgi:hypothetical protein